MNFKIGDKVRVREDLETGRYGKDDILVLPDMLPDRGHVFEIETIIGDKMFLQGSEWLWTPEMLEEKPSEITLEIGYRFLTDTYVRTSSQTVTDDDYAYENACEQFLEEYMKDYDYVEGVDICFVREAFDNA